MKASLGCFRRLVVRPVLWGVAVLALLSALLLAILNSAWARTFVQEELELRVQRAIGREVEVDRLELTLIPLSLHLEGIEIAALEPHQKPVLEAESVVMEMSLRAWKRGELEIVRLKIDRPIARLELFEDGDNFPRFRQRLAAPRWHVEVDAVEVNDGLLELDQQRRIPLSFAARGIEAEVLGVGDQQFEGQARLAAVEIVLPNAQPFEVAMEGRLRLGPGGLRLATVSLRGPDLEMGIRGDVRWGEEDRADFQVYGEAGLGLLGRLGYSHARLEGRLSFEGEVGVGEGDWGFEGRVHGDDLLLEGRRVRGLEAGLTGDPRGVSLALEEARYAGGKIAGNVEVGWQEAQVLVGLDLDLEGLDLAALGADVGVDLPGIASRVDGALSYGFEGKESLSGTGWADLRIRSSTLDDGLGLAGDANISIREGVVSMPSIRLEGGGIRLISSGSYRLPSRSLELTYSVLSEDLEVMSQVLASSLGLEDPSGTLWLPSSGEGQAEGSLWLTAGKAETEVRLDLRDVAAPGLEANRVRGSLRIGRKGVEHLRLELGRGSEGALLVTGVLGGSEVDLAIDALAWPVEDARPWLDFDLPIEGAVSGQLRIDGARGAMKGILKATMGSASFEGYPAGALSVDMKWNAEELELQDAWLEVADGRIHVAGGIELPSGQLDLDFDASGLAADSEEIVSLLPGLAGEMSANAHLGGTMASPRLEAHATSADLRVGASLPQEPAESSFELLWENGKLMAHGHLHEILELEGGGRLDGEVADLRFDLRSRHLDSLLALVAGEGGLPLEGELEGELRVVSDFLASSEVELRLERLSASYREHRLTNLEPVVARWNSEALSIESFYLGADGGGEVFVSGLVGPGPDPELDFHVQGMLEAEWLELAYPELHADGRLEFLGSIEGRLSRPELDGQGEVVEGRILVDGFPHSFDDIAGVLLLYPGEVVLDGIEARMAGGTLLLGGEIDLPEAGSEASYRLQLRAREVSPHWSEGWLLRGDADLSLVSQPKGRQIRGSVRLDRAYYLADVSVDPIRLLASMLERQRKEVGTTDERLTSTQLDLAIDVPDSLRIRNNMAQLDGRATLALRGSLARPVVFGRVDFEPDGSLAYSETKYRLERGSLTFANPYRIEPVLDLVATAEVREYDVTLSLVGTLDRLQPTFSSSPPLPDVEVVRLLLTRQGPASGELASLESSEDQGVGAATFLYGQAASLVSSRFSTLFGLDEVRIQPLSTGTGDFTSSTAVTVGKQLTGDLYVSYAYDPTSTGERHLRVEWAIGVGKLLVLTQNSDGSYAVDIQFENRY